MVATEAEQLRLSLVGRMPSGCRWPQPWRGYTKRVEHQRVCQALHAVLDAVCGNAGTVQQRFSHLTTSGRCSGYGVLLIGDPGAILGHKAPTARAQRQHWQADPGRPWTALHL